MGRKERVGTHLPREERKKLWKREGEWGGGASESRITLRNGQKSCHEDADAEEISSDCQADVIQEETKRLRRTEQRLHKLSYIEPKFC